MWNIIETSTTVCNCDEYERLQKTGVLTTIYLTFPFVIQLIILIIVLF